MHAPLESNLLSSAAQRLQSTAEARRTQQSTVRTGESLADRCITWIEQHFYAPETRGPITLAEYQKAALREALAEDEAGLLRYSTILWGDIKKSIKSTLTAAVIMFWADTFDWSSIKIVANDLKQADSREAYYIRRCIGLNAAYFVHERGVKINLATYKITFPATNSVIEAIPIDPSGEAGGNDDIVVYTELWAAKGTKYRTMWTESTLSPTKFGRSFRWVETYAGHDGEAEILQPLYDGIVQEQYRMPGPWPLYSDRHGRTFAMWNTEPRLPWQSAAYYAQERKILTPPEFNRVHRNQWVSSTNAFVPIEWWDACAQTPYDPFDKLEPLVIALDGGVSDDLFALVGVTRHSVNRAVVAVRLAKVWMPPANGKIEYSKIDDDENYESSDTPYAAILRLWYAGYNIVQVCYDSYQLHDMASRLKQHGIPMSDFAQTGERLESDKQLYDLIRDRGLVHPGKDDSRRPWAATMRDHIQNANAQTQTAKQKDEDVMRLRLIKRTQALKIDLAVCLSMAAYRCLRLPLA